MNAEKRVKELEEAIMALYDDGGDVVTCPVMGCNENCDTCDKYKLFLIAEEIFYRERRVRK